MDDITHALNGATCFTKLDMKAGYHQILLKEESCYITAISTLKGVKQYGRLNFETKSASEMFQHVIAQCLPDTPGVLNISDDILIYGKTIAEHKQTTNVFCIKTKLNFLVWFSHVMVYHPTQQKSQPSKILLLLKIY